MQDNFPITIINDEISDDIQECIEFLKFHNVKYMELRSINKRNIADFSLHEARDINNLLQKSNIKVSAIASPLFKWYVTESDDGNSKKIDNFFFNSNLDSGSKKAYIIKVLNLARIFQTKYVRILSSIKTKGLNKYLFFKDPLLKFALQRAQEENIILLLENEPVCCLCKIEQMKQIPKIFLNRNLKLLFDIANFYRIEESVFHSDLNLLRSHIRYFHLKDLDFDKKKYVPFGEGSINYKRIISDIKQIFRNKEIFLSLETHVKRNPKKAVLKSLANLRKLLKYQRISYGVIGCGRVFKKHALAISNDENSELRAVFDIRRKQGKKASLEYDCEMKLNLKELLEDPTIKVVNICTPHHTHKDLILKIIAANKYCLCEKPLCLSKKEGQGILKSKNYKNNVFVVLQNRFNPAIQFLFKLIFNNLIGKIRLCSVSVRWWRENKYFQDEWHGDIRKVGGMLFNQGIHVLDLMLKICGEPIKIQKIFKRLRKFSDVDDIFVANVLFKSGIIGNVEITTYTKYKDFEASIFVVGDKGTIKIGGRGLNKVEYLDIKNQRIQKESKKYFEEMKEKYGQSHQRLITAFSKYLLSGKRNPNLISAEEGVKVVEFVEKLYQD